MKTTIIKRNFDGVDYDIELTPDELERAYRTQEENYRREDAELHLAPYIESGDILEESVSDVVLDELVDRFFDFYDCNIPENDIWDRVIEEYVFWKPELQKKENPVDFETPESQMELIYHAYQSLLRYDKNSFIFNTTKAGLVDVVNHFGDDVFDGKLKLALEALDNEDAEEAIGFLGEILE